MTNFISTYSVNFDDLKVKLDECEFATSDCWDEMICEHEGSFEEDGIIIFDLNGMESYVNFKLYVSGTVTHDSGDYWTPPYTDVDIDDVDVEIEEFYINDIEVELTKEMIKALTEKVQKIIN